MKKDEENFITYRDKDSYNRIFTEPKLMLNLDNFGVEKILPYFLGINTAIYSFINIFGEVWYIAIIRSIFSVAIGATVVFLSTYAKKAATDFYDETTPQIKSYFKKFKSNKNGKSKEGGDNEKAA